MEKNYITYKGIIHFDPVDKTKKHKFQSNWKRMALVMIDGELSEYYAWFLKKRYNLILNKPLRGAHVSFVNDSVNDMMKGLNCSEEEAELIWEQVKKKWDGVEIEICLDLDITGSENKNAKDYGKHWWLRIPQEKREKLHDIRKELGLGRPFFGLHMSIGYANERNIEHSTYIINLINDYGKEYK